MRISVPDQLSGVGKGAPDHFEYLVSKEGDMDNVCVPPLLFIPFVENAVKHNPDSDNLSYVHIYFALRGRELSFRCENSKPPVPVKRKEGSDWQTCDGDWICYMAQDIRYR